MAHELAETLDLAQVTDRIASTVLRLIRVRRSSLLELEAASGNLVWLATAGEEELGEWSGHVLPAGAGLSARAIAEGRALWSADVLTEPGIVFPEWVRARFQKEGITAVLAAPLIARGETVGVLALGDDTGRVFTDDEIRLASAFADQAAVALANARQYAEAARRRRAAESLAEVGRLISQSLDPEAVAQRIAESVQGLFGARGAGLYRLDPDSGALVAVCTAGDTGPSMGRDVVYPPGTGLVGLALRERCALSTPNVLADRRVVLPPGIRGRIERAAYRAVLAAPLVVQDRVIGALAVRDGAGRVFADEDLRLAQAFADQAAIALENSRLYAERAQTEAELRARERRQAALAELGQRALMGADLGPLMADAVALVARTLSVEYCQVLELLSDGRAFLLRAGVGWKAGAVGHATVGAGTDSDAGYTLLADGPVVVEDLRTETHFTAPPLLRDHGVVSGVTVIIRGVQRPFGILGAHAARPRRFGDDEVAFLQSVANVLGTAIARRRAEAAVRESEAMFRTLAEGVPAAIFLVQGNRFLYVNARAEAMTGYARDELLSMDFAALVHPDFRAEVVRRAAGRLRGEPVSDEYEVKFLTKAGEERWAYLSLTTVTLEGQRAGLGAALDVTARRRTEQALREHAERLQLLREIDQAIVAARSPEAIAHAALRRVRRLVPCDRASVLLFDLEAKRLVALAVDAAVETRFPVGEERPLSEFGAIESLPAGQIRVIEDYPAYQGLTESMAILVAEGIRSHTAVPLLSHDTLIGSLNLASTTRGRLAPEHVEIAREVAGSLAVAIQQARLFAQVLAGRQRLQALSRRLVETQEAERRHIARELHDEIGQVLTGLKLTLEMGPRAASEGDEARKLVNELIARVRDLSLDLRPAMLDDLGLAPALLWHFERYAAQTQVQVRFEQSGLERRFQPDIETAAYRIVQEALTNVARHARVRAATVRLWADDVTLGVQIEDEGAGFDPVAVLAGVASSGLAGMRERAELLGGRLLVDSAPGRGTLLWAELPLTRPLERRREARP